LTSTQLKGVRWSDRIGQLLMEVHWRKKPELIVPLVQALEDQGFRIFSNEANGLGITEVRSFFPHLSS
jgi:hypothetical protein